jgi:hypothetical protein
MRTSLANLNAGLDTPTTMGNLLRGYQMFGVCVTSSILRIAATYLTK